ncbi:hypothetical protein D3C80_1420390 [compost metagenome]
MLGHHNAFGVAPIGHSSQNFVWGCVGESCPFEAVLFSVGQAIFTSAAGVHHAPDTGIITHLEFGDLRANG